MDEKLEIATLIENQKRLMRHTQQLAIESRGAGAQETLGNALCSQAKALELLRDMQRASAE